MIYYVDMEVMRPNFPTEDKSHNLQINMVDPASTIVMQLFWHFTSIYNGNKVAVVVAWLTQTIHYNFKRV